MNQKNQQELTNQIEKDQPNTSTTTKEVISNLLMELTENNIQNYQKEGKSLKDVFSLQNDKISLIYNNQPQFHNDKLSNHEISKSNDGQNKPLNTKTNLNPQHITSMQLQTLSEIQKRNNFWNSTTNKEDNQLFLPKILYQKHGEPLNNSILKENKFQLSKTNSLDFIFSLDNLEINILTFIINKANIEIYYYDKDGFLCPSMPIRIQDFNDNNIKEINQEVSSNVKYIQIKINNMETIQFIGFIKTLIPKHKFNINLQDDMFYLINDSHQNVKVLRNSLLMKDKEIYDNNHPLQFEPININSDIDFNLKFDRDMSYNNQLIQDEELTMEQQNQNILVNNSYYDDNESNLCLCFMRYHAINYRIIYLSKQKVIKTNPEATFDIKEGEEIDLSKIIEEINDSVNFNTNFILVLDNGNYTKLYMDKEVDKLAYFALQKLDDEYLSKGIRNHNVSIPNQQFDLFSLALIQLQSPNYVMCMWNDFQALNSVNNIIVNQNMYIFNNKYDTIRSNLIINNFKDLVFNNQDEYIKIVNKYKDFIGDLQINQSSTDKKVFAQSLTNVDTINKNNDKKSHISIDKTKILHTENDFSYNVKNEAQDELNNYNDEDDEVIEGDESNEMNKTLNKIHLNSISETKIKSFTNLANDSFKQAKRYITVNTLENQTDFEQMSIISFMSIFYSNQVFIDLINNKKYIQDYFRSINKQYSKFSIKYEIVNDQLLREKVNSLILSQKYIVLQNMNSTNIDLDFHFRVGHWSIYVCLNNRSALAISPKSSIYPLPVILEFNQFEKDELIPGKFIDLSESKRKNLEDYLAAFISPENLDDQLKDKQLNDVINNFQFKIFEYSNEYKFKIIEFFKETQIDDKYDNYQKLLSFKIFDYSQDLNNNTQFKLVRYASVGKPFEVYREQFEEVTPANSRFNGIYQNARLITNYCNENTNCEDPSGIQTVNCLVLNREIPIIDQLKGIFHNMNDKSIYDIEFLRDFIDYQQFKQLNIMQYLYIFLQIIDMINIIQIILTFINISNQKQDSDSIQNLMIFVQIGLGCLIFFIIKLILDIFQFNRFTNSDEGLRQWQTFINIIIEQIFLSEKVVDFVKIFCSFWTLTSICWQVWQNFSIDGTTRILFVINLFVIVVNLINFLKQIIQTQKLIIILIEILQDLGQSLIIALVMVVALSLAFQGMELFKDNMIDKDLLIQFDPEFSLNYQSFYEVFYNTVQLAFIGEGNIPDEYRNLFSLLGQDGINDPAYSSLKIAIEKLQVFDSLLSYITMIVIFFYIIILLNFVIAVMSDTYSRITDSLTHYTQHLKAKIVLEQAWIVELIVLSKPEEERWVWPWKVVRVEEDDMGDQWAGQLHELKKQVGKKVMPLVKGVDDMEGAIVDLKQEVNQLQAQNVELQSTIDEVRKQNETILKFIMNK